MAVKRRKGATYPIATKEQEANEIVSLIEHKGDLFMATKHRVYKMVKEDGKEHFEPLEIFKAE